VYVN
jgi:hypothetical protein